MNYEFDADDRYEYVYLIHPKNYEERSMPIYKLGKTYRLENRLNAYPKDSVIYLVRRVSNCHYVEDEMKKCFKRYFAHQGQHSSSEYFKGSVTEMVRCIDQLIDKLEQSVEEEGITEKVNGYYSDRHRINIDNVVDVTEGDSDSSDSSDSLDSSETECISLDSDDPDNENDDDMYYEDDADSVVPHKFSCNDCDKVFTTKQSLGYHIKKKVCHKTPNTQCTACGKIFASRSGAWRHKNTVCKGAIEKPRERENTVDYDPPKNGDNENASKTDYFDHEMFKLAMVMAKDIVMETIREYDQISEAKISKCKTPKYQPSDAESDETSDTTCDAVSEPVEISDLGEEIYQPNIRSQRKRDKNKVKVCKAGPRRSARSRK